MKNREKYDEKIKEVIFNIVDDGPCYVCPIDGVCCDGTKCLEAFIIWLDRDCEDDDC